MTEGEEWNPSKGSGDFTWTSFESCYKTFPIEKDIVAPGIGLGTYETIGRVYNDGQSADSTNLFIGDDGKHKLCRSRIYSFLHKAYSYITVSTSGERFKRRFNSVCLNFYQNPVNGITLNIGQKGVFDASYSRDGSLDVIVIDNGIEIDSGVAISPQSGLMQKYNRKIVLADASELLEPDRRVIFNDQRYQLFQDDEAFVVEVKKVDYDPEAGLRWQTILSVKALKNHGIENPHNTYYADNKSWLIVTDLDIVSYNPL